MTEVVADLEQCQGARVSIVDFRDSASSVSHRDDDSIPELQALLATLAREPKKHAAGEKAAPKLTRPEVIALVAAGVLGFAIVLAAVIFMFRTKDGTLVVEVNQPDAMVQVLDGEGKVEISQPGGSKPISDLGRSRQASDSGREGRVRHHCRRHRDRVGRRAGDHGEIGEGEASRQQVAGRPQVMGNARLPAMGQSHAGPAGREADRSRQQEADGVEPGV